MFYILAEKEILSNRKIFTGLRTNDNCYIHQAQTLAENKDEIQELSHLIWSAKSSDLNTIESHRDHFEQRSKRLEKHPHKWTELRNLLRRELMDVDATYIHKFVEFIPRRIIAVI